MRKRILALLLAAATALGLCACAPVEETDSGKLSVVCSLFPYYDFVRVIGGEWVEPRLLVAAGREAHSFEPTPADVIRVSRAEVFVYNGGEGEQWVDEILNSAGESIPTVLRMMDYAETIAEEPIDSGDHEHEHDSDEIEYDEHIWTSPVEAMQLCRAICDALCAADPAHAADFRANLADYLQELSDLDAAFRQVVSEKKRDTLVFGDRFPLLYFCKEYGLNYRAAFHGCSSDTEPSLYTLKFLIDKVREEQIPVVYALELSSQKVAGAIAETTGAKVVTFYSCQTVSTADWAAGEGYLSLKAIWEHLDFQVRRGDYICIVGENGSGKSTLLKSLLGLLRPLSGRIDRAESLRGGAIGYLPQQTRAQKDFPATVTEVVRSGFLSAGGHRLLYTPAQKAQALVNMGKLGILELKDRCYRELSGGQQQRVLLARALCAAKELLILDEPVTGLDPSAAQDLYRTLAYLNKTEGIAIVMVTHDMENALRYADFILHAGQRQHFFGTVQEYLSSPMGRRFGGESA